jgi:hypothetical protein
MPARDWASQVTAMERSIECLEEVRASRIVPTPGHQGIEEIHIIARPGRRPKQIVRDVESLLFVDFGYSVDYRKISLVQFNEEHLTTTWAKRPRLISVEDISQEHGAVRVTLMEGDGGEISASCTAQADEPLTSLAAKACLQAAANIMAEAVELELKGLERITVAGRDALFSWVASRASSSTCNLLGACFFRNDELTTAASATLDAINRRFFGG